MPAKIGSAARAERMVLTKVAMQDWTDIEAPALGEWSYDGFTQKLAARRRLDGIPTFKVWILVRKTRHRSMSQSPQV